jgi:hypothetical protein
LLPVSELAPALLILGRPQSRGAAEREVRAHPFREGAEMADHYVVGLQAALPGLPAAKQQRQTRLLVIQLQPLPRLLGVS